jgi:hypothetical protein
VILDTLPTRTRISVLFVHLLVFGIQLRDCSAQPGGVHEPVRYIGGVSIDPTVHDGRLRPPIGVMNRQVVRVNRTHPEWAEGSGWTYNHAPTIAYWNDTFYVEYLSNPVDEHIAPGQTLVATSKDGIEWSSPEVVFPPYQPPPDVKIPDGYSGYMMHQRMGFYVAPNGRLLVLAFYGHAEDPFQEGGIGRVVREARKDGTYGPIYFIRYSSHTDRNETNTSYPFYTKSEEPGFAEACNALLADPLNTLQWMDEDRGLDGFYSTQRGGEAFSYYRRKDGKIVGFWKRSRAALSEDGGKTFSKSVKCPTLVMAGGKQWGQKTDDGRYILAYNPIEMDEHRYPLTLISSDDGILFDDLCVVHGEVPPRRFMGRWKDFGPCYVRGIVEGNGDPPGEDLWLTYSVNKEDIWVSGVPVPVNCAENGPVEEDFDDLVPGGEITDWNVYSPIWAPVEVIENSNGDGAVLRLSDKDPYDYAKAVRIFQEGTKATASFSVYPEQSDRGNLEIELVDRYGNRPVRIRFNEDSKIVADKGAEETVLLPYRSGKGYRFNIEIEARPFGAFSVSIDDKKVLENAALAEAVLSVERLSFRTGEYRNEPTRLTPNQDPAEPLPGADEPVARAAFRIDDVSVTSD